MNFEEYREWFLSQYEADEIVDILQIEAESLVDFYEEKLVNYWKENEGRV